MFIGIFDVFLFGILITLNILLAHQTITQKLGCLVIILIFGIILPIISISLEVNRVISQRVVLDNFTLLYVYFKFPVYWFIGIIQYWLITKRDFEK